MSTPSRLLSWVDSSYWMMYPPAFASMRSIIAAWASVPGAPPPLTRAEKDEAIAAARAAKSEPSYKAPASIAILSMYGCISPRAGLVYDLSEYGCPLDIWMAKYQQVMMDSNIGGVIVKCDSPGGNVYQVPECAEMIYNLRGLKPNVGVVTGMSASASYFLSSQFAELVCCPSAEVGCIGVLMQHDDISKMLDEMGVKVTFIESPRDGNKSEGNPFKALAPESKEYYNSRTDEYYDMFLGALARGRGITGKAAKTQIDRDWGRGRMIGAAKALELGMVDRVGTLQGEIDRMAQSLSKAGAGKRMGMEAETERQDAEPANDDADTDTGLVRARARLRLA